ncbi:hypothetical protein J3R83DRAFT_1084 [Lanmaoa asiatica]|nr:hypothetical protein J3R83DRAFT_1084 [Lanmaoa asiatica]
MSTTTETIAITSFKLTSTHKDMSSPSHPIPSASTPPKSQKQMTKAERREQQEAQRAAKAAAKGAVVQPASSKPTPSHKHSASVSGKGTTTPSTAPPNKSGKDPTTKPGKGEPRDTLHPSAQPDETPRGLRIFSHFGAPKPPAITKGDIHPAVIRLGLQFAEFKITGANARCIAMLSAFKTVIQHYVTPRNNTLSRHLMTHLSPQITHLVSARPMSVSMGNAIRELKLEISGSDIDLPEQDAKDALCDTIDNYIQDRILLADQVIQETAGRKIKDGDVVLTYARSSVVEKVLLHAWAYGKRFSVIVVDSRPMLEGTPSLYLPSLERLFTSAACPRQGIAAISHGRIDPVYISSLAIPPICLAAHDDVVCCRARPQLTSPPLSSMSPSAVTSPSPANDPLPAIPADNVSSDVPAKISAYYSLVFPDITFFLQTLTVTIGRRCLPPPSTPLNGTDDSPSNHNPVDVDLGLLKSVSRLHARIEYEEEEARFALVVIGRNGAWVDGVWSGAGSRVPLGERSQIQIASRTFHFVLPPPAALEDSPSPSSASSAQRARSPSVDITSISPPSSLPSHSPSPRTAPSLPPPKPPRSPDPQLPNSNAITRTKAPSASTSTMSMSMAPTSKKRKKASHPPPKPDVMPPKPSLTYAQLCYRAIKAMGGKATLQNICGWMMDNYDWYRYNEGAGWENSVRHNLSSGRAFKKMERSTGEHGKGFFWSVDGQYEHTFEEQEARAAAQARSQSASSSALPANGKDGASKNSRKKDKAIPLDPPLKRSVKSGMGPLPPPLTSTPLISPLSRTQPPTPGHGQALRGPLATVPRGAAARGTKSEPADAPRVGSTAPVEGLLPTLGSITSGLGTGTPMNIFIPPSGCGPSSSTLSSGAPSLTSPSSVSASPFAALPPSVCLPIVIGPVPSSHPSSSTPDPPPIILHNNTLVLSPVIFSSLAPEQLKALEEMGAQKALEVLQGHIVRYLKERMGKKKRKKAIAGSVSERGGTKTGKGDTSERSSPFTTVPLPLRTAQSTPASQTPTTPRQGSTTPHPLSQLPITGTVLSNLSDFCTPAIESPATAEVKEGVPSPVDSSPPVPVPISDDNGLQSPVIVVDDEDEEEGRVTKRRKLGNEAEVKTDLRHETIVARVSQAVDEDIEVDVC